jgi:hypothetical protein
MDAGGPRLRAIDECLQRDEPLDDIPPAPSPRLTKRSSASYFTRSRCRLAIGTTSADKWTAGKPQAVSSVFVKQKAPRNEAQTAHAWAEGVEISALEVQTRPEASCSIDQCKRAAEAASRWPGHCCVLSPKTVQRSLNFMLGRQTSCPLACISAAMALKGVGHVEEGTKRATRR